MESWIGGWDEDDIALDEEEWLLVLELLYERGAYADAALLFGDGAMFKTEIGELNAQLDLIETAEDFALFSETFFMEFEETFAELEEKEAMLYLMAILTWAEEVQENIRSYEWNEDILELYQDWMNELELYGF